MQVIGFMKALTPPLNSKEGFQQLFIALGGWCVILTYCMAGAGGICGRCNTWLVFLGKMTGVHVSGAPCSLVNIVHVRCVVLSRALHHGSEENAKMFIDVTHVLCCS